MLHVSISKIRRVKCRVCRAEMNQQSYRDHLKAKHPKENPEDWGSFGQQKLVSMWGSRGGGDGGGGGGGVGRGGGGGKAGQTRARQRGHDSGVGSTSSEGGLGEDSWGEGGEDDGGRTGGPVGGVVTGRDRSRSPLHRQTTERCVVKPFLFLQYSNILLSPRSAPMPDCEDESTSETEEEEE